MRTITIALVLVLCACTQPGKARSTLSAQGYRDINLTGYGWFACGHGDYFADGFEATSPAGIRVTGTVCAGWLKGATIRFD
ncbi:MAG: hypothetical protein ACRCZI_11160 [Cetobacterium sp.]